LEIDPEGGLVKDPEAQGLNWSRPDWLQDMAAGGKWEAETA